MTHEELIEKGDRRYTGDKIDVYFNLKICQHSGVCTTGLPAVFELKRKPWILPDNESPQDVAELIKKCPSGALQYIFK